MLCRWPVGLRSVFVAASCWVLIASALVGAEQHRASSERVPAAGNTRRPAAVPAASDQRLQRLSGRIQRLLDYYKARPLNTRDHNAWEVMHQVVAFGVETKVRVGGPRGPEQPAIGWLCFNYPFRGFRILVLHNGLPLGNKGYGVQGHHGQLLAILAQSRLRKDYPLRVGSQRFTVADLIENEKRTCRSGMELTFKLIGLSYYVSTTETWRAEDGRRWSISRLLREEIAAPIHGVTCGGTHRLMGYAYAVWKRRKEGLPIDGEFYRAEKYLADYHRWAFKLQNSDGSFSSQWLRYRAHSADPQRRLRTTGHILEWLAFSLPEEELTRPEMLRAVEHLVALLERNPSYPWAIGPLGHALHGLAIYRQRALVREKAKGSGRTEPLVAPNPRAERTSQGAAERSSGRRRAVPAKDESELPLPQQVRLRQATRLMLQRIHSQVVDPAPAAAPGPERPRQVQATGPVLVGPR